jgi:class 3 adenylate cyclase
MERSLVRERVERRLMAILVADVVGYSRLIGADDEGTHAHLKDLHNALVVPKIKELRGRIVRTTGDGLLVLFASVVDCLRCAVEIQRDMVRQNEQTPLAQRIVFRMGINVGDVIVDGRSLHGDGVNVAARLEALAEPGGICVSERVWEDVQSKFDVAFEDAGKQQLKNISRPVRIFHVRVTGPPTNASPPDTSLHPARSAETAAFPGKAFAFTNIPIRVPTHFMGRDDALAAIEIALKRYEGRVAITALHGLRGVGKTTLAAAFWDRHRKDYRQDLPRQCRPRRQRAGARAHLLPGQRSRSRSRLRMRAMQSADRYRE